MSPCLSKILRIHKPYSAVKFSYEYYLSSSSNKPTDTRGIDCVIWSTQSDRFARGFQVINYCLYSAIYQGSMFIYDNKSSSMR